MADYPPEPFKIKAVEQIRLPNKKRRLKAIKNAGFNTFLLSSEDVFIDLLTDSGTSAMSDAQWAGLMRGDEAYAGSKNFANFELAVRDVMGYEHVVPTHQGRGAENILYKCTVKPGDFVPRNMYFTTSKAHIELNGGTLVDVIIDEAHDPTNRHPFKGNLDLDKLQALIDSAGKENVPFVNIEQNVNMAGGQPISIDNVKKVRDFCDDYELQIYFDATRAAENAYFIKDREPGYKNKSCADILRELCSYSDGCIMSAKKDALVNIGGFLATNDKDLFEKARSMVVVYEGLHTYGGLAGRDLEAVAIGLREGVDDEYLASRIAQVRYLGERLLKAGVPIVEPIGGHAVFLDAKRFLPHIPQNKFPAQALTAALYVSSGVRTMERGAVSAGRDKKTGKNIYPKLELVRVTIPRRVYTKSHIDYVADSIIELYENRDKIKGLRMVYEPKTLRFFQARFEEII